MLVSASFADRFAVVFTFKFGKGKYSADLLLLPRIVPVPACGVQGTQAGPCTRRFRRVGLWA